MRVCLRPWILVCLWLATACGTDELVAGSTSDAKVGGEEVSVDSGLGTDVGGTDSAVVGTDATGPDDDADAFVDPDTAIGDADEIAVGTDATETPDETGAPDLVQPGDGDATGPGEDGDAMASDDVDAEPDEQVTPDVQPACKTVADCPAAAACQGASCDGGVCKLAPVPDATPCDDGSPCTAADQCTAGACGGTGVSCDDGNPCTEDACVQPGGCAHQDNAALCEDGSVCTKGDACAGGKCLPGSVTTSCDDGNVCTDDSCDAKTGCVHPGNAAPCVLADACQSGTVCSGGACTGGQAKVCDDGNPCTADSCDSKTGLCLASDVTTACDDGNACTSGDACSAGKCLPGAQAKVCDDSNPCTADSCDTKTGGCVATAKDGACEDGSVCTLDDKCGGGVCLPGAATACDDANPCTDDTCDAKLGCTAANNTAPCSVGGDVCQLAQCNGGKCAATGKKGCDDGNPCTNNACDPVKGCQFPLVADGATCAAADACSTASLCLAGQCKSGKATDCDDSNPCTDDKCDPANGCVWQPNSAKCEDGNPCTAGEVCKNGKCPAGVAVDAKIACDDSNACTEDACDAKLGCTHKNNVLACEDGSVCTKGDACNGGACKGGPVADCDDGKVCTNDLCDAKTGVCSWTGKGGACEDGSACTANDACANGNCQPGSAKNCDDANPCTVDACDAKSGLCTHVGTALLGVPCDDGNACTGTDLCKGATCAGSAKPMNCDDANVCTTEGCDTKTGACTHVANTVACDDGNKCTAGDVCDGKAVCAAGKNATCDDKNICTTDSCDAGTGACKHVAVADGAVCDDGIACTAASACKAGNCAPAKPECSLLTDTFECAAKGAGWTLPKPFGYQTVWAVDQTPAVPNPAKYLCTMNYNDGTDYCDYPLGNNFCYPAPNLTAVSPIIDESVKVGLPHLSFDTFYELDGPKPGGTGFGNADSDVPRVILREDGTNVVLDQFLLSKSTTACGGPCQGVWRTIDIDVPKVAGKKFHVELSLASPTTQGNKGKGWFVDNLKVTLQFSAEKCSNGIDDDGNGKIDCADPACASACKP